MNKTIHKYTLPAHVGPVEVLMPTGARVLSAQVQRGQITVWAVVQPDKPPTPKRFFVALTGGEVPDGKLAFIDTLMFNDGTFVVHVFEQV